MPIRKPCKGRTRRQCKSAKKSCAHVGKSSRARSYCRKKASRGTRKSTLSWGIKGNM